MSDIMSRRLQATAIAESVRKTRAKMMREMKSKGHTTAFIAEVFNIPESTARVVLSARYRS